MFQKITYSFELAAATQTTPAESLLLSMIYLLQTGKNAPILGWANAEKDYYAKHLRCTTRNINKMIARFRSRKLIETSKDKKLLRIPEPWMDVFRQELSSRTKQTRNFVPEVQEQSSRVQEQSSRVQEQSSSPIYKEDTSKDTVIDTTRTKPPSEPPVGNQKSDSINRAEEIRALKAAEVSKKIETWQTQTLADQLYCEQLVRRGTSAEQLADRLQEFVGMKTGTLANTWKNQSDFRKNFMYWLDKKIIYNQKAQAHAARNSGKTRTNKHLISEDDFNTVRANLRRRRENGNDPLAEYLASRGGTC